MRKTVRIRKHELGLWFRHGELHQVLEAGKHTYWNVRPKVNSIEVIDTLSPRFKHEQLKSLVRDERLASRLSVIDLKDTERALVWVDGRLDTILSAGVYAYWTTNASVEVERYSVNDVRFEHPKLDTVMNMVGSAQLFHGVRVDANEKVMLFRDGELVEQLGAGNHVYWRGGPTISWKSVDLREQVEDIQGQEIMTADKVTLRVNLLLTHRLTDAVKAVSEVLDWRQTLYREAQLELRAAIGARSLEKLLADKDELGAEIKNRLAARAAEFGVTVSGVGLRDIILPGDMKTILNQVIVAEKQAQANLIRRREETAAARSQANTAKLLEQNPVLARMKELEALQEILRGTDATFVLGAGDLSEQIGQLMARQSAK